MQELHAQRCGAGLFGVTWVDLGVASGRVPMVALPVHVLFLLNI